MKKEKKYVLVPEDTITISRSKLYRIRALKSFERVKKGDLGGYIESVHNLKQEGNCWVYDGASVFQDAVISDNACVLNNAMVYGKAKIKDNAKIMENARVHDRAQVYGDAIIFGHAEVMQKAMVYGSAVVRCYVHVGGKSHVYGNSQIRDRAHVYDDAHVFGNAQVSGESVVSGHARIYDKAKIMGHSSIGGNARVFGNALVDGGRVYGNSVVYDMARVSGHSLIYDSASVYGDASVCGAARVCGDASVYGNAKVSGMTVSGNANVYGNAWLKYGEFSGDLKEDLIQYIACSLGVYPINGKYVLYTRVWRLYHGVYKPVYNSDHLYKDGKVFIAKSYNPNFEVDDFSGIQVSTPFYPYDNFWKKDGDATIAMEVDVKDVITCMGGRLRAKRARIIGEVGALIHKGGS